MLNNNELRISASSTRRILNTQCEFFVEDLLGKEKKTF